MGRLLENEPYNNNASPRKPLEMPRKVVINGCYGGFSLSETVKHLYKDATKHVTRERNWFADSDIPRDDPDLIRIIETLGLEESGGFFAKLKIIELPDDLPSDGWEIKDYDGIEWVAEKHRTWS